MWTPVPMAKHRYLLLVESDGEPRQTLGRWLKSVWRWHRVRCIDYRELPAESKERLADQAELVKAAGSQPPSEKPT